MVYEVGGRPLRLTLERRQRDVLPLTLLDLPDEVLRAIFLRVCAPGRVLIRCGRVGNSAVPPVYAIIDCFVSGLKNVLNLQEVCNLLLWVMDVSLWTQMLMLYGPPSKAIYDVSPFAADDERQLIFDLSTERRRHGEPLYRPTWAAPLFKKFGRRYDFEWRNGKYRLVYPTVVRKYTFYMWYQAALLDTVTATEADKKYGLSRAMRTVLPHDVVRTRGKKHAKIYRKWVVAKVAKHVYGKPKTLLLGELKKACQLHGISKRGTYLELKRRLQVFYATVWKPAKVGDQLWRNRRNQRALRPNWRNWLA